jgi:hypothetical protein
MAQSAEADRLRIIFETDRPGTEAVIYETFNTAFDKGDAGQSRYRGIVNQRFAEPLILKAKTSFFETAK